MRFGYGLFYLFGAIIFIAMALGIGWGIVKMYQAEETTAPPPEDE